MPAWTASEVVKGFLLGDELFCLVLFDFLGRLPSRSAAGGRGRERFFEAGGLEMEVVEVEEVGGLSEGWEGMGMGLRVFEC